VVAHTYLHSDGWALQAQNKVFKGGDVRAAYQAPNREHSLLRATGVVPATNAQDERSLPQEARLACSSLPIADRMPQLAIGHLVGAMTQSDYYLFGIPCRLIKVLSLLLAPPPPGFV